MGFDSPPQRSQQWSCLTEGRRGTRHWGSDQKVRRAVGTEAHESVRSAWEMEAIPLKWTHGPSSLSTSLNLDSLRYFTLNLKEEEDCDIDRRVALGKTFLDTLKKET